MAKFKNVSPLGALDIPTLGRVVEAGETFEVPADLVAYFADQTANFKALKTAAPKEDKGAKDELPPADEEVDPVVDDAADAGPEAEQKGDD